MHFYNKKNTNMAQLDVQPKKHNGSWLPWLLLVLGLIALAWFLSRGCNGTADHTTATTTDSGSVSGTTSNEVTAATSPSGDWNGINFNSPAAAYDEITDSSINVRGGDGYAIYSLGENVLFETDKAAIRGDAQTNLKQLTGSLAKRFNNGEIRIYGHTDAKGSAGYNQQLAEQRAEAVKDWLIKNGKIDAQSISVHPVGESDPVASNATESGRQQNRRVEIVARSKK